MSLGLTTKEVAEITATLCTHDSIKAVVLFGSRATGNFKKTSDVDLALKGKINFDALTKVAYQLNETTKLPYHFDVVVYDDIDAVLKERIDHEGVVIYQKK